MPAESPHRFLAIVLVALGLLAILFMVRACASPKTSAPASSSAVTATPEKKLDPPAPKLVDKPVSQAPTIVPKSATNQLPSTATGMLSMTLHFSPAGLLVEGDKQVVPDTAVRVMRGIEGQPGIYHRIVAPDGQVLFENLVPDPREVHWDTTDDGKKLRGGVITQPDLPLNLRLPAGIRGKLEVYLNKAPGWSRSTLAKSASLLGTFDLQ